MAYRENDLVVYGTTGVCRVEGICRPNLTGADRDREYYLLKPLHQDGIIYAPLENAKVPMRPVISQAEVEDHIALIPTIRAEIRRAPTLQALAQDYQASVRTGDCRDLLELVMSIYAKRVQAESQKRRLGMVDERYMKQAERLLYGEFAVVLGIDYDAVQPYIRDRLAAMEAQ